MPRRPATRSRKPTKPPVVMERPNYGLIRKPRPVRPVEPTSAQRSERDTRRRRRLLPIGVLIIAVAGATGAWLASRPGGSTSPGTLAPEAPLDAYRLVYQVQTPGGSTHEEERDISRPFEGRYLERSSGAVTAGFLTTLSNGAWAWVTAGSSPGWIPAEGGLNQATADEHAVAALSVGLRHGLARVVGHGEVLSRACTRVRTGSPLGEPLSPPTSADHADLCVDATGLVLSERWLQKGKVARTRTAVSLDLHPNFTEASFAATPVGDLNVAGGTTVATVRPATDQELAQLGYRFTPPAGYSAAAPPALRTSTGGNNLPQVSEVAEFFTHGTDLLTLIEGFNEGTPAGYVVPVPAGSAYVSLDMTATSVEVVDRTGRFARLEGPDVSFLVAAASGLAPNGSG